MDEEPRKTAGMQAEDHGPGERGQDLRSEDASRRPRLGLGLGREMVRAGKGVLADLRDALRVLGLALSTSTYEDNAIDGVGQARRGRDRRARARHQGRDPLQPHVRMVSIDLRNGAERGLSYNYAHWRSMRNVQRLAESVTRRIGRKNARGSLGGRVANLDSTLDELGSMSFTGADGKRRRPGRLGEVRGEVRGTPLDPDERRSPSARGDQQL